MLELNFIKKKDFEEPEITGKPVIQAKKVCGSTEKLNNADIKDIAYVTGLMDHEMYGKKLDVISEGARMLNIVFQMNIGTADDYGVDLTSGTVYDALDYLIGALHEIENYIVSGIGILILEMGKVDELDTDKVVEILKGRVLNTVKSANIKVDSVDLSINVIVPVKEYNDMAKKLLSVDERHMLSAGGMKFILHNDSEKLEFSGFYDLDGSSAKSEMQKNYEEVLEKYCDLKDMLEEFGETYALFRNKRMQELKGEGRGYKETDIEMEFKEALRDKETTISDLRKQPVEEEALKTGQEAADLIEKFADMMTGENETI